MARFNASEVDNYGGQGGGGFFSLKNDKDVATIRFMYNTIDDIEGYAVHEVELDGKKRYVNCLREYNEPIENCPLCAAKYRILAKLFLHVYDEAEQEVKVWDRGKTYFSKMASLASRHNPLVATPFEIERNGKKGDMKTIYETYALQTDETTLDDLPEIPELLGGLILDKSAEELEFYLEYGYFEDEVAETVPPTRGGRRNPGKDQKPSNPAPEAGVRRRTPANTPATESARSTGRGAAGNKSPRDKF